MCRQMLEFISLALYTCQCRDDGFAQNVWQEKVSADEAYRIFMHMKLT